MSLSEAVTRLEAALPHTGPNAQRADLRQTLRDAKNLRKALARGPELNHHDRRGRPVPEPEVTPELQEVIIHLESIARWPIPEPPKRNTKAN